MTARIGVVMMVLASAGGALAQEGGSTMRMVITELRKLRVEVLDLRLELQERRIPELQRDLEAAAIERRRVEQEVQMRQEALAEMDRQLAGANLSAEDRAEFEKRRLEIGAADPLQAQQALLAKREADIRSRLEHEFNRWQSLTVQKLKAAQD
jgi:hypothetical protein